ncbi:MAG: hypothetical protein ACM3XZ_10090 [Betaproteobacteria bacterium]
MKMVGRMKRRSVAIGLGFALALTLAQVSYATLPPKAEIEALANQAIDFAYKCEAGGMTYQDYNTSYQNLYVAYHKYLDKYPEEPFKPDMDKILNDFDTVRQTWDMVISGLAGPQMLEEAPQVIASAIADAKDNAKKLLAKTDDAYLFSPLVLGK